MLAVAINLLNPQAVVIGGDMAAAFDMYAAGVRESVYARAGALATRDLQFVPATHGDRAGVVGCAALALDHVLSPGRRRRPAGAPPASDADVGATGRPRGSTSARRRPFAATTVSGMTRVHAFADDALGDLDAVGLVDAIRRRPGVDPRGGRGRDRPRPSR